MEVPRQDMNLKLALARQDAYKKRPEPNREVILWAVPNEQDARIKIPSENENGTPRLGDRLMKGSEVGFAVDQKGRSAGQLDTPAIPAGLENRLRRCWWVMGGIFDNIHA
jgi:hypothetical protein